MAGMEAPRTIGGRFDLLGRLGAGMQGKVYRARDTVSGDVVALKLLDRVALGASGRAVHNLQRELEALRRLQGHAHIVKLLAVDYNVEVPRKRRPGSRSCVMLVLELAPRGELFDYLMFTGKFEEPLARAYFTQLLGVLAAAHACGVFHRDLKPENILLGGDYSLRVGDWGLSAVLAEGDAAAATLLRTSCGSKAYMSPEALAGRPYTGEAADVWSAGVLLFIMLCGAPPFVHAKPGDWWFDRLREGRVALFWAAHERTHAFSPAAKDLLTAMFAVDPARRLSVEDAAKHPWCGGAASDAAEVAAAMAVRRAAVREHKGLPAEAAAAEEEGEGAARAGVAAAAVAAAVVGGGAAAAGASAGAAAGVVAAGLPAGGSGPGTAAGAAGSEADKNVSMADATGEGGGVGVAAAGAGAASPFTERATRGVVRGGVVIAGPAGQRGQLQAVAPQQQQQQPAQQPQAQQAQAQQPLQQLQPAEGGDAQLPPPMAQLGRTEARLPRAATIRDSQLTAVELPASAVPAVAVAALQLQNALTAFTLPSGMSAAQAVKRVAAAVLATGGSAALRWHPLPATAAAADGQTVAGSIKLKCSVAPSANAAVRYDVRFYALPGTGSGAGSSRLVADAQRSSGDIAGFLMAYQELAAALGPEVALPLPEMGEAQDAGSSSDDSGDEQRRGAVGAAGRGSTRGGTGQTSAAPAAPAPPPPAAGTTLLAVSSDLDVTVTDAPRLLAF